MKKILLISICVALLSTACNKDVSKESPEIRVAKYTQAIQKNPNNAKAYIELARAYNDIGGDSRPLALQNVDKALSLPLKDKDKSLALIQKSRVILREKPEEALKYLDEAIVLDPKNEHPWRLKGLIYGQSNDSDKAIEAFNRAINLDNKKAWSYYSRGEVYFKLNKMQEAISDYSMALKYAKDASYEDELKREAYFYRGLCYYATEQQQLAIDDFTKSEQAGKNNNPHLWKLRGLAYQKLGKGKESIVDLKKYATLAPEQFNDSLKIELARAYFNGQEYDNCIELLNEVITFNQKDANAYNVRGGCFFSKQDYQKALSDFEIAAQKDPSFKGFQDNIQAVKRVLLSTKPEIQTQFENLIATYKEHYRQAGTDLQKGYSRTERKQAIRALNMNGRVKGWVGVIQKIGANNEGKAYVSVALNRDLQFKTWNNALSDIGDNTLIPPNSPVYNTLLSMKQGQKINFSGSLLMSRYSDDADYYKEGSLSTSGAMLSPEFLFYFDEIIPLE